MADNGNSTQWYITDNDEWYQWGMRDKSGW